MKTLAVIGCGASAVMLIRGLCNRLLESDVALDSIKIDIFERSGSYGKGQAYDVSNEALLCNTWSRNMGVDEAFPEGFCSFLEKKEFNHSNVPRQLFGDYLESVLDEDIKKLKEMGIDVVLHTIEVINLTIDQSYILTTSDKKRFVADYCVISSGGCFNNPLASFNKHPKFIANPMSEELLSKIPINSKVGIIGMSQSAIDVCLFLDSIGIFGQYLLFSRKGFLPRVKSYSLPYKKRQIIKTCKTTAEAKQLIFKNIYWKSLKDDWRTHYHTFRSFCLDVKRAKKGVPSWQKNMDELTTEINPFWIKLDKKQKHSFLNDDDASMLYYLRSAIPIVNADKFIDIHTSGRVKLSSGEYQINSCGDGFLYRNHEREHKLDYIVNASGLSSRGALNYLNKEITAKKIALNDMGGLYIDQHTMTVLDVNYKRIPGLFALGYPIEGSLLLVNSIELLRPYADLIAANLFQSFQSIKETSCV